ncbi:MAG TPA: hypothetical protein HA257_05755 [Candidatus Methanoperedenaceae archaeon]|nr:hypothetical protein [Candidatus Methanoperedenaceae archaeon]
MHLITMVFIPAVVILAVIFVHAVLAYLSFPCNDRKHVMIAFGLMAASAVSMLFVDIYTLEYGAASDIPELLWKFANIMYMFGIFFFFCFLSDFVESVKRYIMFVLMYAFAASGVTFFEKQPLYVSDFDIIHTYTPLAGVANLGTSMFWLVIAYWFYRFSREVPESLARKRMLLISAGSAFPLLMYAANLFRTFYPEYNLPLHIAAVIFVTVGSVVFYVGFTPPDLLKKYWTETTAEE